MLKDPLDPDPARRYKAIGWSSYDWDGPRSGIYSATSPDGINWSHSPDPIFRYHPRPGTGDLGPVGDAQSMMVDIERRRYVAFLRGVPERLMSTSDDFVHWSPPRPFLAPLNEEEALYNNTGFNYGAHYLGILTHFDKRPRQQTQVLRLLCSRDGERWHRVPGEPLVGLAAVGEWDRFQLMLSGAPPIAVGDKLYIYYRGTARRHAKIPREFDPPIAADQDPGTMGIGLAMLRLDGFASLNASFDGGQITTRPFALAGGRIASKRQSRLRPANRRIARRGRAPHSRPHCPRLRRHRRGRGRRTRALARRPGFARIARTAGAPAFRAEQRPAVRLLVFVAFRSQ